MPNINTEQVRQSLAMASDDVLLSMWKQVSKGGVQNLDYDIVKAFADEISERGLSHRLNERSENKMKISKRQLKRIIREEKQKLIKEGTHEKLNADVTGDSSNLDQEVYFGLEQGVIALIEKFANDPRYAQHGVTYEDVLEELKLVVGDMI